MADRELKYTQILHFVSLTDFLYHFVQTVLERGCAASISDVVPDHSC